MAIPDRQLRWLAKTRRVVWPLRLIVRPAPIFVWIIPSQLLQLCQLPLTRVPSVMCVFLFLFSLCPHCSSPSLRPIAIAIARGVCASLPGRPAGCSSKFRAEWGRRLPSPPQFPPAARHFVTSFLFGHWFSVGRQPEVPGVKMLKQPLSIMQAIRTTSQLS